MTDEASPDGLGRRAYLRAAAGTGIAGAIAGCSDATPSGDLNVRIADQEPAIDGLESCELTIVGLWLQPTDELPESPGIDGQGTIEQTDEDVSRAQTRQSFRFGEPRTVDLVDGGGSIAEIRIDAGAYEFLQFQISGIEAGTPDGVSATVTTPARIGTMYVLQFDHGFELEADGRTEFVAGVRPVRENDRFLLRPVADRTIVR